ncbi:MAG: hypothetical protein LBM78_02420 [Clostridiales bacterium]|jgi:hypothetical protein|nr:hypothetical protein [Clostridiales bacterium]
MTLQTIMTEVARILRIDADDSRAALLPACCNLAVRQIAEQDFPLVMREEHAAPGGVLSFSDLSERIIRLKKVTDGAGNAVAYTLFPDRIEGVPETVHIFYSFSPADVAPEDAVAYPAFAVSLSVFAYAAAAELCLLSGLYDEAAVYDARYRAAVTATARYRLGEVRLPSRAWR